jgi:hypothetical protein
MFQVNFSTNPHGFEVLSWSASWAIAVVNWSRPKVVLVNKVRGADFVPRNATPPNIVARQKGNTPLPLLVVIVSV